MRAAVAEARQLLAEAEDVVQALAGSQSEEAIQAREDLEAALDVARLGQPRLFEGDEGSVELAVEDDDEVTVEWLLDAKFIAAFEKASGYADEEQYAEDEE